MTSPADGSGAKSQGQYPAPGGDGSPMQSQRQKTAKVEIIYASLVAYFDCLVWR
jgi:hypothetical protein